MIKKPPFLIVFEGIDGCGKFTQATLLKQWLEGKGKKVGNWTEPNGVSLIGKLIRDYLNKKTLLEVDPHEFQRMFVIDRAQNIFSHLVHNEGGHDYKVVERFALSTIAFGMLSGRPAEDFIKLHTDILGPSMIWPDLTVILDVSADTAISRINLRRRDGGKAIESFEKKKIQEKVRENYLALTKRNDIGKIVVLDGERPPEKIFEDAKREIINHFELPI